MNAERARHSCVMDNIVLSFSPHNYHVSSYMYWEEDTQNHALRDNEIINYDSGMLRNLRFTFPCVQYCVIQTDLC